jgi:type I restriction enzyme S subunit
MSETTTHIEKKTTLVPDLRFTAHSENFKEYKLSQLMTRYSETNKDEEFGIEDILSLSSRYGIVRRNDILEDQYDKVNHINYKKTRLNDFVYGKSITAGFPFGLFKANNLKDGLLSSLYFTFKVNELVDPTYLDFYFSYQNRANNFLRKFVLVGDRYITADADFLLSGKIHIPSVSEQQKIASFLSAVDEKIQQLTRKKELLEQYKKGVMQQIFSQHIRFKDVNEKEFPEWEQKRLKEIATPIKRTTDRIIDKIMTISGGNGFMDQKERFSQVIAGSSLSNYTHLLKDEFAYNRGNSKSYTYGCIYKLKVDEALIPYVYHSFKLESGDEEFMEQLFKNKYLDRQLRRLISSSARMDGLLNIGSKEFFQVKVIFPALKEQQKIASLLSSLDAKIESVSIQLTQAQTFKKGLLQKMFV